MEIDALVVAETPARARGSAELPSVWTQTLPSLQQLSQIGLVSSHLTCLFLQVRHPWDDLPLNVRLRWPLEEKLSAVEMVLMKALVLAVCGSDF